MNLDIALNELALQVCDTAAANLSTYGELVTVLIVFGAKGGDTLQFNGANNCATGVLSSASDEMKEQMNGLLMDAIKSISKNDGHSIVFVSESNVESNDIKAFTVTASNRSGAVTYLMLYKTIEGKIYIKQPSKLDDVLNGWIEAVWKYV